MNVTFASVKKSEGDTFFGEEEEPALSSFEKSNLDEFKSLLDLSQNWEVIKNYNK